MTTRPGSAMIRPSLPRGRVRVRGPACRETRTDDDSRTFSKDGPVRARRPPAPPGMGARSPSVPLSRWYAEGLPRRDRPTPARSACSSASTATGSCASLRARRPARRCRRTARASSAATDDYRALRGHLYPRPRPRTDPAPARPARVGARARRGVDPRVPRSRRVLLVPPHPARRRASLLRVLRRPRPRCTR